MGVTIKDIARIANVSKSTVSKALNDRDDVSQKVKDQIQKLAKDLNYMPNNIARSLITGRSYTIGVFIVSRDEIILEQNFGIKFLDGIAETAERNNYDIYLFTITKKNSKPYIQMCRERKIEAAIFIGLSAVDPNVDDIKQSDIPVAVIDNILDGDNVFSLGADNEKGIMNAMDYLYEMGHRKIHFINGGTCSMVARERERVYRKYMQSNDLDKYIKVYKGNFSVESGYEAGKEIVESNDIPSAVMASSDYMAIGLIKILKKNGLRIPEDVSVVGFDNIIPGIYTEPALTTVDQQAFDIGKIAVEELIAKHKDLNKTLLIEPKLIVRESVIKI